MGVEPPGPGVNHGAYEWNEVTLQLTDAAYRHRAMARVRCPARSTPTGGTRPIPFLL